MDADQFRRLWEATRVAFSPEQRLELLYAVIADSSTLDVNLVRGALAGDPYAEPTLVNMVCAGECSIPKALARLRQVRGEDSSQEEQWEFFNDSLTVATLRNPNLQRVSIDGDAIRLRAAQLEHLQQLLSLEDGDAHPADTFLGGVLFCPNDNATCVLAIYNSPRGPYVDPFVVFTAGPQKTRSLPPRKSLAEPFEFVGIGEFNVRLESPVTELVNEDPRAFSQSKGDCPA